MQPPRPFRGANYDKNMFTFLPAASNRDVLAESSRKRKLMASDHQSTTPAPTIRPGFVGMSDPNLNTNDLLGKELQNSVRAHPLGESLHLKDYPHESRHWEQNNYSASWHPNKKDLHGTTSEYIGYSSFSGRLQPPHHTDPFPSFHRTDSQIHKLSRCPPLMAEDLNQRVEHEAKAHVARKEHNPFFQEFQNGVPDKPAQMTFAASVSHELASEIRGESERFQKMFLTTGTCVVGSDMKDCPKASTCPPLLTGDFIQLQNPPSRALVAKEDNVSHFQEFQNCGMQKPSQVNVVAADSCEQASKNLGELQNLQQNFLKTGAFVVGVEQKGCHEETYKFQPCSNVKERDEACSFAKIDSFRVHGYNVVHSVNNLPYEPNHLLQNVLRLLSAASGVDLSGNSNGKIHSHEDDSQNVKQLMETILSKTVVAGPGLDKPGHVESGPSLDKTGHAAAGPNLDKPDLHGEKGSVKSDKECKPETGAFTLTEKLWDGILQLSSSVSVPAIAFFKSGEKMQDFSWSESVEVKGKVRLEAFEKYVQGLPRSRTRGLMVMSLCWKEGSTDATRKSLEQVAHKYKEGKRVGFAQRGSVDMYICPNSETIITILAKHGFFKGLTAVKVKGDPLIGCVVWRKNTSSVSVKKTSEVNAAPSGVSGSSTSVSSSLQVADEISSTANKNQEPLTLSSEKDQTVNDSRKIGGRQNSPEFCVSPHDDQPRQQTNNENKLALMSGTTTQMSALKTDVELNKPNVPNQGAATSDDDDLPEYDFRTAVSHTSTCRSSEVKTIDSRIEAAQFKDSHVPRPMSAQMMSESSTICRLSSDSHFQALVPQNMERQSNTHATTLPIEQQKQITASTAILKPPDLAPKPMSVQMGIESSTISRPPPDSHFKVVPQNIELQSNCSVPTSPKEPPKQITASPKPPGFYFEGPFLVNRGHQPEIQLPSLPEKPQNQIGNCTAGPKPRNLFDDEDDDMPEWCPPDFMRPNQEVAQQARAPFAISNSKVPMPSRPVSAPCHASFASSHSNVPMSGSVDSVCGHLPSLPPSHPASISRKLQVRDEDYPSAPHFQKLFDDQPASNSSIDDDPDAPPGFAPNPAAMPCDPRHMKETIHPPHWRGLKP